MATQTGLTEADALLADMEADGTEATAPEASDEDDEELVEGEDDEVVDLDDDDLAEDPGRNALLRDLFGEGSPDAA